MTTRVVRAGSFILHVITGPYHLLHVITGLVPVIPLLRGAALQAIGFTGTTPAMTLGRCHYRACPGEPDRKTAERIVRTMRRFKV